jgi:Ser/Thr protein kinase RdoA (MazF antagonist)
VEFARLSNDEQLACLGRLADSALDAWGMQGAGLQTIKYRENAVFEVTSPEGSRHVLRVHRPNYRTDTHIRSEFAWMKALSENGIPTPAAVPTQSGDVLTVAIAEGVPEPRQCDLITWVDGKPVGTLEGGVDLDDAALHDTYRTVGTIAARIQEHGASWRKPSDFVRPAWDVETLVGERPTFGRFWDLEVLTESQRTVLFRARDRVREALVALPADALVHGDLLPDNLLASADGIRIIDFDDCGWSWYGFELATSLFSLLVTGGFEAGLDGYLEGYRSVAKFPEEELALLPTFLMARALSYLGWPAGRPEIESGQAMAPFLAGVVTDLAERYLADALGAG